MNVSTQKIKSVFAAFMMLGFFASSVAAMDASGDFVSPNRTEQINASLAFADAGGIMLDMTQDGTTSAMDADKPVFNRESIIRTQIAFQETVDSMSETRSNPDSEAREASEIADLNRPPLQKPESRLDQGTHSSLLKWSAIGNVLVGMQKKYDPRSMTQSGNIYWFFDSQKELATGQKAKQLIACSRMMRWLSICASTNARTFSVYIRNL